MTNDKNDPVELENLDVEPLSDEDLDSVAGGEECSCCSWCSDCTDSDGTEIQSSPDTQAT